MKLSVFSLAACATLLVSADAYKSCRKERDVILSNPRGIPVFGQYVPQCDEEDRYEKVQCHGSTGYCWCVNIYTGAEFPGTQTPPGYGKLSCLTCPEAREEALASPGGYPVLGRYVPRCDGEKYTEVQCNPSTGWCWKVNVITGIEIPSTRFRHGPTTYVPAPPSVVTKTVTKLKTFIKTIIRPVTVTQSTTFTKEPVTITERTTLTLDPIVITKLLTTTETSVSVFTKPVTTTEVVVSTLTLPITYFVTETDIISKYITLPPVTNTLTEVVTTTEFKPTYFTETSTTTYIQPTTITSTQKVFVPKTYTVTVVHKVYVTQPPVVSYITLGCYTEYSTFTDRITYKPRPTTVSDVYYTSASTEIATINPPVIDDEDNTTQCFDERKKALDFQNSGAVGVYVPTCDNDGLYASKQCHGSTGYCWCANPLNGDKIEGTSYPQWERQITC